MLAENLMEEFEMKEDEPWYDQQDLQQDLQLAAELGKTLLDRNTELEESLQHMYTTNQEQLQEIEYLTKQVELLRQMNEQHAKVYEQLDVTARELEETNQKLVSDSKASQQKILSLTETIECLQSHVDHLQNQMEELKTSSGRRRRSQERSEQGKHFVYDHIFAEKITSMHNQQTPDEEENENLKKTVTMLQAQLNLERKKRMTMEEEYGLVLKENCDLEQQLGVSNAYQARALELEAEVAEMRQMLQTQHPFVNGVEKLVSDSLFLSVKEPSQTLLEEIFLAGSELSKKPLKRSSSEIVLSNLAGSDIVKGHEETCIRKTEAMKQRGISLLHEVDTQYRALKVKYEELLKKCQQEEDSLKHKAVQTCKGPAPIPNVRSMEVEPGPSSQELASIIPDSSTSATTPPPEYKALFKEIFSCIKKTKQEIDEQRTKYQSRSPRS
ncbi:cerebellar degeneration-related protein 2 isoform X2 [Macrotis lagotis]|uniref:cerebellar degeneration-related protein 2 isoform X2 n=1 Tax=Macrotis lagotis TaxID=92651 RepID=UPI003D681BA4